MLFGEVFHKLKNNKASEIFILYAFVLLTIFLSTYAIMETLWQTHKSLTFSSFELFSIFIALTAFIVAWLTYGTNSLPNNLIGFGFVTIAILGMFHLYLSPVLAIHSFETQSLSACFWISERISLATVLFLSSLKSLKAWGNKWTTLSVSLLVATTIIVLSPIVQNASDISAYSMSKSTIIACEIFVTALFIVCAFVYWKKMMQEAFKLSYKYILIAILLAIPNDICFIVMSPGSPFSSCFRHLLKIVCYYYLFKSIFTEAVTYPYEKLTEVKEELREILNGLPIGVVTYDKNSRPSFVNTMACKLVECTPDDLYNSTREQIKERFKAEDNGMLECTTPKGNRIKLSAQRTTFKNGLLVSLLDARKEQEFDNLKMQTSAILNSINNLVLVLDPNRKIIICNKSLCDCIELTQDELIGKDYDVLKSSIGCTIAPFAYNQPGDSLDKNSEVSFTTPSGIKKELFTHSSAIYNVYNECIGIICIGTDITEFKAQQRRIQQQEKLAIIGQMGSGIVHETKNHLASIKGYCQLINQKYSDSKLKDYVSRIESITSDVNRLISDFLSLAKPSAPVLNTISLNWIIESMRYMIESPSFIRGIKLDIQLGEPCPDVLADEQQIKQVVLNLAKNAIEAMADTESPRLKIETYMDNASKQMVLTVSDNGKGISEKDIEELGTPFFTTKKTGTGLGLSVSYKIIKEHNGTIEVQSIGGMGTKFTICLPCISP